MYSSINTFLLFVGEYAESPKGLKVGDRVKIDVDAQRLEELQTQRSAWDPELAKVSFCLHPMYCKSYIQCMFLSSSVWCNFMIILVVSLASPAVVKV